MIVMRLLEMKGLKNFQHRKVSTDEISLNLKPTRILDSNECKHTNFTIALVFVDT